MGDVPGHSDESGIGDLRRLARRLEAVGPVLPMGVVASTLGLSRMQVWRLMQEGRLKTEPIYGARFVCLSSVVKYAERQERRRKRKRMRQEGKNIANN